MEPAVICGFHDAVFPFPARFTGQEMNMIQLRSTAVVALCLAFVAGCGDSGGPPKPKVYKVSGSVALDGAPVVGATVTFWCEESPKPATGITDKDGKFQLSTYDLNDGAIAGDHKITVVKDEAPKVQTTNKDDMLNNPGAMLSQYQKKNET